MLVDKFTNLIQVADFSVNECVILMLKSHFSNFDTIAQIQKHHIWILLVGTRTHVSSFTILAKHAKLFNNTCALRQPQLKKK